MLAAKAALAVRYDALNEETRQAVADAADEDGVVPAGAPAPAPVVKAELGLEHRARLEARLRQLEEQQVLPLSVFCIVVQVHHITRKRLPIVDRRVHAEE